MKKPHLALEYISYVIIRGTSLYFTHVVQTDVTVLLYTE